MMKKEKVSCPTCGHTLPTVSASEYEFCKWVAGLIKPHVEFKSGAATNARGAWYLKSNPGRKMTAPEISIKFVIPTIEEASSFGDIDLDSMGFRRHWKNYRNVAGMYRVMSGVGFHLLAVE